MHCYLEFKLCYFKDLIIVFNYQLEKTDYTSLYLWVKNNDLSVTLKLFYGYKRKNSQKSSFKVYIWKLTDQLLLKMNLDMVGTYKEPYFFILVSCEPLKVYKKRIKAWKDISRRCTFAVLFS